MIGPVSPLAAIWRKSSHIVTVVLVTLTKVRVTAFQARQHVEPHERPQAAQERAEHKMSGSDEEHLPLPGLGRVDSKPQFVVEKRRLIGGVFRKTFLGGTGRARTRCHFSPKPFKNRDTRVGRRSTPVRAAMRWQASAMVRAGCCSND